jgi:hypothetical protein
LPNQDILGRVERRIKAAMVPLADKSALLERLSGLQVKLV